MVIANNDPSVTAEYVRQHLDYDQDAGVFRWKSVRPGRKAGAVAGCVQAGGYVGIKLDGRLYKAHRLAWLYVNGQWPSDHVDHVDCNRSNNAISNLRIATPAQNAARRPTKRAIAPSRGVFPHGPGFVARIHHAGKRHYLGYFRSESEARSAYEAKAKEIHGEFAYEEFANWPPMQLSGAMSGALSFGA